VVSEADANVSTSTVQSQQSTPLRRSPRTPKQRSGLIGRNMDNYGMIGTEYEQIFRSVEETESLIDDLTDEFVFSAVESEIINEQILAAVVKSVSGIREPKTYGEAMKIDPGKWKPAFDAEYKSITDLGVYTLVKLPPEKKGYFNSMGYEN